MTGLRLHTSTARVGLTPKRPLRLTGAAGVRLLSVAGVLWVTIDRDPRDHVLQPGESLAIDSSQPVLVTTLGGPATLGLCSDRGGATAGGTARWRRWTHRWMPQAAGTTPAAA